MFRVSTMSTVKEWSAVLAFAILVLANTSTAQDFLNERPESNYEDPWSQPMRPNWTPPRRPGPNQMGVGTRQQKVP